MTDNGPNPPNSPPDPDRVQQALRRLATDREDIMALGTLANSEVLLPVPEEVARPDGQHPDGLQLPVFEQTDGARLVPVFTSEDRLVQALPEVRSYRTVPLAVLSRGWPTDDLTLSIDAGSPETLTVQGQGVRALATLSSGR